MKVLREGHRYELANFENKNIDGQVIQFIEKETIKGSDEMFTAFDGTTNEEVLGALIHRLEYLQKKFPCVENATVIEKLHESLFWLNKRTEDRKNRMVEGKSLR